MKTAANALLLLAITTTAALGQRSADVQRQFDDAEGRIVRLAPSAVPELPASVVRELRRRGCTIPQTTYTKKPHNAIKGEFAKPGERLRQEPG